MYRIAYAVATRNRPEMVEYYINFVSENFKKYNIGLYFYDGSDNDETKKIVNKYNYSFIYYEFCPHLSLEERIAKSFVEVDSEYLCYGGDSQLPKFENFDKLMDILKEKYTLINLSYRDNKNIGKKVYTDIVEMFKDNCWDMTLCGSVFLRKCEYKKLNYSEFKSRYTYGIFIYMIYYFDYLKDNIEFKGYYEALPILSISPLKIKSAWSNNVLEIWGEQWSISICELDKKYNINKKSVILDHSHYSSLRLDSIIGFLVLKRNHIFSLSDYLKYRKVIKKISRVSSILLVFIALIPNFIVDLSHSVYKGVKS